MQNKLAICWWTFFIVLISFIFGVEIWHRYSKSHDAIYQCRILIDKDFSIDEGVYQEEENKAERISLYEKTNYGILPRKQSDNMKIFNAYSSNFEYSGKYVKVAVLVENATAEKIYDILKLCKDFKITFIILHYVNNLSELANIIVSSGNEFFIQLPTQSSIPEDKRDIVSPFLANASQHDTMDKLYYLIGSAKYAIGIANTSASLITKSKKDMEIIFGELSKMGLAFLNINEENDVLTEIKKNINVFSLDVNPFKSSAENFVKENESILITSDKFPEVLKLIPKDMKMVPISFKAKNASL